jgi:hypothetical protein
MKKCDTYLNGILFSLKKNEILSFATPCLEVKWNKPGID